MCFLKSRIQGEYSVSEMYQSPRWHLCCLFSVGGSVVVDLFLLMLSLSVVFLCLVHVLYCSFSAL